MPHGCQAGKQPLTWEGLRKLADRETIYIQSAHMTKPYAAVLRWELPGQALEATACICAFDPSTMDDTHVLARYTQARFEQKQPKIWWRVPTTDEIVCSEPQMTRETKWWEDA